jgi:L-iditol 2-dehydrogenase
MATILHAYPSRSHDRPHEPIEVRSIDDPVVESGGVLIETVASEVCGTDVHLHHGKLAGVPFPIIPGHVSVGRVLEAPGVERDALGVPLNLGDLVTFLDVHEICGQCYHCTVARQPNRCPMRKVYGITYSVDDGPYGGWAERIYLQPGMRALKLDEGLTADDVIGGGCGLFTGFASVYRSDLEMGDIVLVQGAGPVGLSASAFANLRGAGRVIMIGAPEARLELARNLGVDVTFDLTQTTPEERSTHIMEITHGRGVDVVLEASGNPRALPEAFGVLRDGGAYVVAGHYTDAGPVEVNPHTDINRKHIRLLGQWGTEFHHLVGALRLLGRHRERLPFAEIIGARYGLEGANEALADVAALRVTKAIITPQSS